MTIAEVDRGDVVVIGEETYRLMIRSFDSWGCRKLLPDGEWSMEYTWFLFDNPISKVVRRQNSGGASTKEENVDPLARGAK